MASRFIITIINLNIGTGAGMQYSHTEKFTGAGVFEIAEVSYNWGRLASGEGWISMNFCSIMR